jgi:hypothetical protein
MKTRLTTGNVMLLFARKPPFEMNSKISQKSITIKKRKENFFNLIFVYASLNSRKTKYDLNSTVA